MSKAEIWIELKPKYKKYGDENGFVFAGTISLEGAALFWNPNRQVEAPANIRPADIDDKDMIDRFFYDTLIEIQKQLGPPEDFSSQSEAIWVGNRECWEKGLIAETLMELGIEEVER